MHRRQARKDRRVPRGIMALDWARLTDGEREQAIEIAREQGRRWARWYLAEAGDGSGDDTLLRRSRWAEEHGDLHRLDDATFSLYASARTLACADDYGSFVVEPYCPERAAEWWGTPEAKRREDPRVCAFCDRYERERRQILGMDELPTRIPELQRCVEEAREEERESGRYWLLQTAEPALTEAEKSQQFVARWEYHRCTLAADLAQMLLEAARYRERPGGALPAAGVGERGCSASGQRSLQKSETEAE